MKRLLVVLLMLPPSGCIAGQRKSAICELEPSKIDIEFKRVARKEAWGKIIPFAEFSLKNSSSGRISIPIEGSDGLIIPHGEYEFLESRARSTLGSWVEFDPNLDEFSKPTLWITVDETAELTIFSSVFGPVSVPDQAKALEFRLHIRDAKGCDYFSQPFQLPEGAN